MDFIILASACWMACSRQRASHSHCIDAGARQRAQSGSILGGAVFVAARRCWSLVCIVSAGRMKARGMLWDDIWATAGVRLGEENVGGGGAVGGFARQGVSRVRC